LKYPFSIEMRNTGVIMKSYICLFFAWLLAACALLHAAPSWKRIGLEGIEVTSLCRSLTVDVPYPEEFPHYDGLFIGTKDYGVYQLRQGQISYFGNTAGPEWPGLVSIDTCVIHSLVSIERNFPSVLGPLLYAGTDKGLYVYAIRSGLPSGWLKMNDFPETNVWDLLLVDSVLYAGADYRIYRSQGPVQTSLGWDTLDMAQLFPQGEKPPRFCCLFSESDSSNVIMAGSKSGDILSSWSGWTGVVRSTDLGDTWEIWNRGWGSEAPSVNALETYFGRYLAGTDNDLFARSESDTAWIKWGYYWSGLENREIRDLHKTYDFWLYVATDSGVYCQSPISSSIMFRPVGFGPSPLWVNALASGSGPGDDSLFAGTSEGLYLYTEHDSTGIKAAGINNKVHFAVYPNPFGTAVEIALPAHRKRAVISIYNSSGQFIGSFRNISADNTLNWNAGSLANGVYLIKANVDGKVYSKKVLLQR
jgi:hypothetical protein